MSFVWVSPHAPQWLHGVDEEEIRGHGLSNVPVNRRRSPRYGPLPVGIKLSVGTLNECRGEARKRNLPLSDYVSELIDDKFNPP